MIALSLTVAATLVPISGAWDCKPASSVITASYRLQTGEKTVASMKAETFLYRDFGFKFEGDEVVVRLRDGADDKDQRVPYFRKGNYLTFNFNEGLTKTGWASPLTFWTNEASQPVARYEVSFPLSVPRTISMFSGPNYEVGDAAMAVAALSCQKRNTP